MKIQTKGTLRPVLLAAALLLAGAACEKTPKATDPGNPDPGPHNGVYTLLTVGGDGLPFVIQESPVQRVDLQAGRLEIGANRRYRTVSTLRVQTTNPDGNLTSRTQSETELGTYTRVDDAILFRSDAGSAVTGMLGAGDTLAIATQAGELVYLRTGELAD